MILPVRRDKAFFRMTVAAASLHGMRASLAFSTPICHGRNLFVRRLSPPELRRLIQVKAAGDERRDWGKGNPQRPPADA